MSDYTKRGARNRGSDKKLIREIRSAARQIQDHTLVMEPDDEDGPSESEQILGKAADLAIVQGNHVKALGDGKVGGYLVRYTDAEHPDLTGDFFTSDTDFDTESGDRVTVYYNHGLDPMMKRRKLARGTVKLDDIGVWVEAQLEMRDEYERAIYEMASTNKLGWSSGTLPNLVEREPVKDAYWIKHWPIGKDASLTPTPAAGPELTKVTTLKSVVDMLAEVDATNSALLPEATGPRGLPAVDSADGANTEATKSSEPVSKENPMDTQTAEAVVPQPATPTLSELLEQAAAKAVDAFAKAQTPTNAVPVAAPAVVKKLGDTETSSWATYLRTGDEGGIKHLRASEGEGYSIKASNNVVYGITTAANAGDLVPVGHYQNIVARMRPQALYPNLGVMMIPGKGTTVNVPIDTEADDGAFVSTAESAAFDRDAPSVARVAMTLVKYTKKIDLTYELLQDEDSRVMDFLETYVAAGLAATYNSLMIAAALAGGTAGTSFAAAAITPANMMTLLYSVPADYARQNMAWVMARATEGYLRGLATATPFAFAPTPSGTPRLGSTGDLSGVPVYNDPNMPALATGQKSIIVGNWGFMGARIDPELTFLRDPYTRAANGEVILLYYTRCVFKVLQAAALQYGTHA